MAYSTYFPAAYGGYPPNYTPRMDMMPGYPAQQTMQQAAQAQQAAPQQLALSPASRPVTNRDEANAVSADFSGSLMVFPDITHNRVYIKRWNYGTGAADFFEYAPVPTDAPKQEAPAGQSFATLEDLQDMQSIIDQLKTEIERLKRSTGKAGKKNDADE